MPIAVRSWMGLLAAAKSVGLRVYEPPGRCDFFVYVPPSVGFSEDALRSNFHLHIFLASNIAQVSEGQVVSVRIETVLPKTVFAGGGERPNLAEEPLDEWENRVKGMAPKCTATELAARLFAEAVRGQMTAPTVGVYATM